jgi:uncharacterized Fe-S cluster-containing radical SAM superfamily protein
VTAVRIRTDDMAARMRTRIIRPSTREILITRLQGSAQQGDLTSPVNCGGLGRVRHFHRETAKGWPSNVLPIDPAARALSLGFLNAIEAQVFQNAACAWRCWYCYVPFELLGGDERRSEWITADELVNRYAALEGRPPILDLSGGSPDLTPEWIPWTIEALHDAGIADTTYLWSDDNLSTDLVFEVLDDTQRRLMASHPLYGRVCCFKGFDSASFAFNTGAEPGGLDAQFDRFAKYVGLGLNLSAYVTLTGPNLNGVEEAVSRFVDRLRRISPDLPSRTVPLRIEMFGPTDMRMRGGDATIPFAVQELAIAAWNKATGSLESSASESAI